MTVNGSQWLPMAMHSLHMKCHLFSKCPKKCLIPTGFEHIPLLYHFSHPLLWGFRKRMKISG